MRVFDDILRLLHPFTPFVTEELWGHLKLSAQTHAESLAPKTGWEDALIVAKWPEAGKVGRLGKGKRSLNLPAYRKLCAVSVTCGAEKKVEPGKRIAATLVGSPDLLKTLEAQKSMISMLCKLDDRQFEFSTKAPANASETGVNGRLGY